ncbi:uncharacterized protein zgc:194210 [Clupea harengus]|uniref:Uncharacterized protein zgc:194210 n=1 Tax=Clupea harengus TaxID=7950 RepID=A0A6P8GAF7_CLUHA|nr:uncharacterized protein zgc:194210 [Clupea harengus]
MESDAYVCKSLSFVLKLTAFPATTERGDDLPHFLNDAFQMNQPSEHNPEEFKGLLVTPGTSAAPTEIVSTVCTTPGPVDDSMEISNTTPEKTSTVLTDIIEAMSQESSNSVEAIDARELSISAESREDGSFRRSRTRSRQKAIPARQEFNYSDSAEDSAEMMIVQEKKDVVEVMRPAERPAPVIIQDVSSEELHLPVDKKGHEIMMMGKDKKPADHPGPQKTNPSGAAAPPAGLPALRPVGMNSAQALNAPVLPDLCVDSVELCRTQRRQAGRASLHASSHREAIEDTGSPGAAEVPEVPEVPHRQNLATRSEQHPGSLRRIVVHISLPESGTMVLDRESTETREVPDTLYLNAGSREFTEAQLWERVRRFQPSPAPTNSGKTENPGPAESEGGLMGDVTTRVVHGAGEDHTTVSNQDAEPQSAEETRGLQGQRSPGGPITTRRSQGGPITTRVSQGGPITTRRSQGGPITTRKSQGGGPITTRRSQGGPITTRMSPGGPITTRSSQGGGPITTRVSQGGPITTRMMVSDTTANEPEQDSVENLGGNSTERHENYANTVGITL